MGRSLDLRVLAVFERVCNLVSSCGSVVALVTPKVGDGPLNVVLEGGVSLPGGLGPWGGLQPGAPARWEGSCLKLGAVEVEMAGAKVWEPRPDWEQLRSRLAAMRRSVPRLQALALAEAPEGSLLALIAPQAGDAGPESIPDATLAAAREGVIALRAGWAGDLVRLQAGAAALAGLGGGLTPSGDDLLSGVMLWAWLDRLDAGPWCEVMCQVAAPRTTTLAAALLGAAARGECSAAWHLLLVALADEAGSRLAKAVQAVLAHGQTSGGDALAGFLWAGGTDQSGSGQPDWS
jgi:hypothetical protein